MKTVITTLSAMALASALSLAQDKPPGQPGGEGGQGRRERPNPEEFFKRLDKDGNGSISLDEYKASPRAQRDPARAEESFKKMDKDSDGKVTLEEFKAGRPERPGGRGQRGEKPPGGKPGEKPSA